MVSTQEYIIIFNKKGPHSLADLKSYYFYWQATIIHRHYPLSWPFFHVSTLWLQGRK
ncbi:hypothetical protein D3C80_255590 [compost metagenome]